MGARHSRVPDPRACPLFSTPYLGKAPDADERPAGEAYRLVRLRDARNALGGACSEVHCIVDEEIGPGHKRFSSPMLPIRSLRTTMLGILLAKLANTENTVLVLF